MRKLGFVGWRGMVGTVLMNRMIEENDFSRFENFFFSTSDVGGKAPEVINGDDFLFDAFDLSSLIKMDIIVTCQGGDYTDNILSKLRAKGWSGFWIDSSSVLRMNPSSKIVLDPVNLKAIKKYISDGGRNLVGGNCTVSLLLLALHGLFREDLIEWVSSMTYQAVSGVGAKAMEELYTQMREFKSGELQTEVLGAPIACNLLPWIDSLMDSGQTREEWKGEVEANKILDNERAVPIDGICVRVPVLRCHSQALTIKLKKSLSIEDIESILTNANEWVDVVENRREVVLDKLTPVSVSGTLDIRIGRVRKMSMGDDYLTLFTVGDQLLWGAAEPLRRVLRLI